MNEVTTTQAGGFAIEGMTGAMHLAKAMSSAKMVPNHLQGSPGDCLMVIEQAMRWQMSPFAVAQATAVVRGKMCFEGKLVAAAIQTSGVLEGRLNYDFEGEGEGRKVICSGLIRGEKKPRTVEVLLKTPRRKINGGRKHLTRCCPIIRPVSGRVVTRLKSCLVFMRQRSSTRLLARLWT